jgi:hypothetical protein
LLAPAKNTCTKSRKGRLGWARRTIIPLLENIQKRAKEGKTNSARKAAALE